MKFYFLFTFFLIANTIFSQENDFNRLNNSDLNKVLKERNNDSLQYLDKKSTLVKNNLIKVDFFILSQPGFSLQYERKIFNKTAAGIAFGFTGNQKMPLYNILVERKINDKFVKRQLDNVRFNSFSIAPEIRFYFGKDVFKGFYIAPFVRYAFYNISFPLEYKVDQIDKLYNKIDFKGNLNAITAGVSLGAQWNIYKNFYLDWLIIGPHIGKSKEYLYANKSLSLREQHAISKSLNLIQNNLQSINNIAGINIPVFNYDYDINDNGAKIEFKERWAGIRMFVGVGFRF
jgi:hypothetical protein